MNESPSTGGSPGPPSPNLDRVRAWAETLDVRVETTELAGADGASLTALQIYHGELFVWAIDRGGYVDLVFPYYVPEDDAARLAAMADGALDELLFDLRLVLLEGRCGYAFRRDGEDRFAGFDLTQRFVPAPQEELALQRLADGIQELVTVGLRGAEVLGVSLQRDAEEGAGPTSRPHPGMYG